MKRVLVTGAGGIIGRVLVSRLADRYELITHTHRPSERSHYVGDISSFGFVQSMIADAHPDAIAHLAADATLESGWDAVLNANIIGTYNVFEVAREAGVSRIVFASTNHVIGGYELDAGPDLYQLDDVRTYNETTPARPDSLYGVSKVFGEALGRLYSDRFSIRVICLRIGSVLAEDDPVSAIHRGAGGWLRLSPEELLLRYKATWLSQRDCAELFARALESDVQWAVAYGTSDNQRKIWDLTSAAELLGFHPVDRA